MGDSKIDMPESSSVAKGVAPLVGATGSNNGGYKRGLAIFDLVLRIGGIVAALAAASAMGTSDQTLPFFTQFFQFQACYEDLPTFQFFVIAMGIVAGYLALSLPFSIVAIVHPNAACPRLLLLILDIVITISDTSIVTHSSSPPQSGPITRSRAKANQIALMVSIQDELHNEETSFKEHIPRLVYLIQTKGSELQVIQPREDETE